MQWHPNTCGCKFVVETKGVIAKCSRHSLIDDADLYDTVLAENQKLNRVVAYMADNFPDTKYAYSIDASSNITVTLPVDFTGTITNTEATFVNG